MVIVTGSIPKATFGGPKRRSGKMSGKPVMGVSPRKSMAMGGGMEEGNFGVEKLHEHGMEAKHSTGGMLADHERGHSGKRKSGHSTPGDVDHGPKGY